MSCGCQNSASINSWVDLSKMTPQNPMDLIAYAEMRLIPGFYVNSSTFLIPGGQSAPPVSPPFGPPPPLPPTAWAPSPFAVNGQITCQANESDNMQMVSDARDWNMQHQTVDTSAFAALPIRKILFLRGGTQWMNSIPLSLGPGNYSNLQLSFRDNAATRGDYAGTYPVIEFANVGTPFTGNVNLNVVLNMMGRVSMVIRAIDNSVPGVWSMFEMEWMIVP